MSIGDRKLPSSDQKKFAVLRALTEDEQGPVLDATEKLFISEIAYARMNESANELARTRDNGAFGRAQEFRDAAFGRTKVYKDAIDSISQLNENQLAWVAATIVNTAVKSEAYKDFYLSGGYTRDTDKPLEGDLAPWEIISPMALGRMTFALGGMVTRGAVVSGRAVLSAYAEAYEIKLASRYAEAGAYAGGGSPFLKSLDRIIYPGFRMYIVPPGPSLVKAASNVSSATVLDSLEVAAFTPTGRAAFKTMSEAEKKAYLQNYAKQISQQEEAINSMTVNEFIEARQAFKTLGRNPAAATAQEQFAVDFEKTLRENIAKTLVNKKGYSVEQAFAAASEQAASIRSKMAALHNPDMVAGGYYTFNPTTMGDAVVNSAIGASWRWRVSQLDNWASTAARNGAGASQMNVKLRVFGGK